MRDLFTAEINRQAEQLAAASCRGRIERLTEALRAFAFEPVVTVRAAEVWEDTHGLLPPKIVAGTQGHTPVQSGNEGPAFRGACPARRRWRTQASRLRHGRRNDARGPWCLCLTAVVASSAGVSASGNDCKGTWNLTTTRRCPLCGADMRETPAGLCPACLMKQAMATCTSDSRATTRGAGTGGGPARSSRTAQRRVQLLVASTRRLTHSSACLYSKYADDTGTPR